MGVVIRKALAVVRLAAWVVVLYAVAAPWRRLGGLVSEDVRWLEWFVLFAGVPVGFEVGALARGLAEEHGGRWPSSLVARAVFYPPLALTALGIVSATLCGRDDLIGVVLTGLLSYSAGADASWSVKPLFDGDQEPDEPGPQGSVVV
jgi:hypothetical protein